MHCPVCGLINPDSAAQCDCGYDFPKKLDIPEPEEFRWLTEMPVPRTVKKEPDKTLGGLGVMLVVFGSVFLASWFFGWMQASWTGIALGSVVGVIMGLMILLFRPDRSAKLLTSGNLTFGKIVNVEWLPLASPSSFEGEDEWRLLCVFASSDGTVHTIRTDCAKALKVGDVLPVFYEIGNPDRNYLLIDPQRIVRR